MSTIQVKQLVKTFGKVRALDGLDLEVKNGCVYGFLGPNGAGKTTTLRILAGLAQPDSGTIHLTGNEEAGTRLEPKRIFGYLPEEPSFYPWMTPIEYLDFCGQIFGYTAKDRKKRIDELLDLSGLAGDAKRRIGGFSRGMRQRLGMAQALVNKPEILLLDEPLSALDPAGRKDILSLIESLSKSCTVLMSTHILNDVERVCDTVGIINHGRMVIQANRQELLEKYATRALEIDAGNGDHRSYLTWIDHLKRIPGVISLDSEGTRIRVAVDDLQSAQAAIVRIAAEQNLGFERIEIVKPTLEDIFMQLVGAGEEKE